MSKRLQVLLQEPELREIQRAARAQKVTVAECVRAALCAARRSEPTVKIDKRMEVVRAAILRSYPTVDIDQMLFEIERGYAG